LTKTVRILVIADPHIPIPPVNYGGAERIIAFLCAGLAELGHEIRLLAAPGSKNYGGGLWAHGRPTLALRDRAFRKSLFQPTSLLASIGCDVVINFGRTDYLEALLRTSKPMLICFQNPAHQTEMDWILSRRRGRIRFVGVSHAQMAGLVPANLVDVIHNVANTQVLTPIADAPRSYLAFLGRLTANKGVDTAISVAKRTGWPLKIAGTIMDLEPGGKEFFEQSVRPHLGGNIEFVGPVNDQQKRDLLAGAAALLFPIRWAEPFGIVMAEALACGTPVIASRLASTPEVIEHGKTGFLCDSEDEMGAAVGHIQDIDRNICRRAAEARFSPKVLVQGYLNAAAKLVGVVE